MKSFQTDPFIADLADNDEKYCPSCDKFVKKHDPCECAANVLYDYYRVTEGLIVWVVNSVGTIYKHTTRKATIFKGEQIVSPNGPHHFWVATWREPELVTAAELHEAGYHTFKTENSKWPYLIVSRYAFIPSDPQHPNDPPFIGKQEPLRNTERANHVIGLLQGMEQAKRKPGVSISPRGKRK